MEIAEITLIDNGDIFRKTVQGFHFSVEGFEFLDLFIYQLDGSFHLVELDGKTIRYNAENIKGKYAISESSTGMYLGRAFDDAEEAISEITKRCQEYGVDKVKELLANGLHLIREFWDQKDIIKLG